MITPLLTRKRVYAGTLAFRAIRASPAESAELTLTRNGTCQKSATCGATKDARAAAAAAPDQGGEARLDLSEGSTVVMMLALRDSPWRQPRNPARHISPKALVLRAECLLERRFFDHHHPDMKKKPE